MALRQFRHQMTAEPEDKALAALKKVESGLSFLLISADNYPAQLKSLEQFELRNVAADLARHPILEGPTFRPVFDIR